jgi:hypothetical protein
MKRIIALLPLLLGTLACAPDGPIAGLAVSLESTGSPFPVTASPSGVQMYEDLFIAIRVTASNAAGETWNRTDLLYAPEGGDTAPFEIRNIGGGDDPVIVLAPRQVGTGAMRVSEEADGFSNILLPIEVLPQPAP